MRFSSKLSLYYYICTSKPKLVNQSTFLTQSTTNHVIQQLQYFFFFYHIILPYNFLFQFFLHLRSFNYQFDFLFILNNGTHQSILSCFLIYKLDINVNSNFRPNTFWQRKFVIENQLRQKRAINHQLLFSFLSSSPYPKILYQSSSYISRNRFTIILIKDKTEFILQYQFCSNMKPTQIARDILGKIIVFKSYKSFSFCSKGSRPNHSNQLVRHKIYGFSQNKPSFQQQKIDLLTSQLKRLSEKHQGIQAEINQAIAQKKNLYKQLDSENQKISKMNIQMKNISNPNPQNMKKLRQKEQAIESLKIKIKSVERVLEELDLDKQKLKKQELNILQSDFKQKKHYGWFSWFSHNAGVIITIFIGFIGLFITVKSQFFKEKLAVWNFSRNNFNQDLKNYISGSLIQNQFSYILNNPQEGKILFIAGCPGVGKSTSIRHLIQQHSQNKNRTNDKDNKESKYVYYYIDLNSIKRNRKIRVQYLQHLLSGIYNKYQNQENLDKKSVKLIIDDINRLEELDENELSSILQLISTYYNVNFLQVICISSSSRFVQQLSGNAKFSAIQKRSDFKVLQDLSGQYQEFFGNVLVKYYPKITESAKTRIIKNKDSLRNVIGFQKEFENLQTEKQQLNFLEEYDKKNLTKINSNCSDIFLESNSETARMLVEKLINSEDYLSIDKCMSIKDEIIQKHGKPLLFNSLVQKLEKNNMIIFCRPRSLAHRNGFKLILNKLIQQDSEKKRKK